MLTTGASKEDSPASALHVAVDVESDVSDGEWQGSANPNLLIPKHTCGCLKCVCLPVLAGCAGCSVLCCRWCLPPRHRAWKGQVMFEAALAVLRASTHNICRSLCCIRMFTDPPLGVVCPWLPYSPSKYVRFSANWKAPGGGEWFFPSSKQPMQTARPTKTDPKTTLLPPSSSAPSSSYAPSSSGVESSSSSSSSSSCCSCCCCCSGSLAEDPQNLPNMSSVPRVVLYFHGGAYALCTSKSHRMILMRIVAETGATVLCIDYRRPPEHPYPAARDDCIEAYRWLLEEARVPADRIMFAGDSAGGGLVLSVLGAARDAGMPMPAGGVMWSPWVDLSDSFSGTWTSNQKTDFLPRDIAHSFAVGYAGTEHTLREASPCSVELDAGLPPLLIECGDAECLHDQVEALVQRAEAVEGMDVEFHACEGMVHVFPLFYPFCKAESEPVQAFKRMAQFGDRVWGTPLSTL